MVGKLCDGWGHYVNPLIEAASVHTRYPKIHPLTLAINFQTANIIFQFFRLLAIQANTLEMEKASWITMS